MNGLDSIRQIRDTVAEAEARFCNQNKIYSDQLGSTITNLRKLAGLEIKATNYSSKIIICMNDSKKRALQLTLKLDFFSKYASERQETNAQARERIAMHIEIKEELSKIHDNLTILVSEMEQKSLPTCLTIVNSNKPE